MSPTPTPSPELTVLQAVLAGEHAAVWAYGTGGARLTGAQLAAARADEAAHRARRDAVAAMVVARGGTPVAAAPDYGTPTPVTSARAAVLLLTTVEQNLAAVHADAVGGTRDTALRAQLARWLQECAIRGARWRGGSVAFPGLPERLRS
jgi:hypothetical protein